MVLFDVRVDRDLWPSIGGGLGGTRGLCPLPPRAVRCPQHQQAPLSPLPGTTRSVPSPRCRRWSPGATPCTATPREYALPCPRCAAGQTHLPALHAWWLWRLCSCFLWFSSSISSVPRSDAFFLPPDITSGSMCISYRLYVASAPVTHPSMPQPDSQSACASG